MTIKQTKPEKRIHIAIKATSQFQSHSSNHNVVWSCSHPFDINPTQEFYYLASQKKQNQNNNLKVIF